MKAVIDTNILVSALWKPSGNTSRILWSIRYRKTEPCYDSRMMEEYTEVLSRPKFNFRAKRIKFTLDLFLRYGICVEPDPLPGCCFKLPFTNSFANREDSIFYLTG